METQSCGSRGPSSRHKHIWYWTTLFRGNHLPHNQDFWTWSLCPVILSRHRPSWLYWIRPSWSLELLAVLWWKCVLGMSCLCPWFRPQSSTANLFGFNHSSPWLMIFLPFLSLLIFSDISFLYTLLYCPSWLNTFFYSFLRTLSSYLSTCVHFSVLVLAISMLMLWLCCGKVVHKHSAGLIIH